jgi:glycyl-tRNA synthetase
MAHYASDCWDLEISGEYGWVECVGIAHRGCYDLEAHEAASGSGSLRAWRAFDSPREIQRNFLKPIAAIFGPTFKQQGSEVKALLQQLDPLPTELPFKLTLVDGTQVEITADVVERTSEQRTEHGEWYLPHVVEPSFGIDRIIWHLLDHAFLETEKEEQQYVILKLNENVAPIDLMVFPLMEKDGLDTSALNLNSRLLAIPGIFSTYDGSGSIGRRYARADEIGVPWAITVDYESMQDDTVTIRRRDDQRQVRASIDELLAHLDAGNLASLFST